VARSVSVRSLAVLVAAAGVGGCSTTQQEAARLQLNSARIRASELPTRVTVAGRAVRVTRVVLVHGRGGTAFVVQVKNPGARTVSDLPISVGVSVGRRRSRYLNLQSTAEDSYYDAHLPAVRAGATLTWVYAASRALPAHARPFAIVGATPSVATPRVRRLPMIRASASPTRARGGAVTGQLAIALQNLSSIPQYQMQIYAYAQVGDRYLAAGNLTVPHLGSQAHQTAKLALLGRVGHAPIRIEALPTIVQ
jgi:hypothetical protein